MPWTTQHDVVRRLFLDAHKTCQLSEVFIDSSFHSAMLTKRCIRPWKIMTSRCPHAIIDALQSLANAVCNLLMPLGRFADATNDASTPMLLLHVFGQHCLHKEHKHCLIMSDVSRCKCRQTNGYMQQLMCAGLGWWFISLANAAFWWVHAMLDVCKPWLILQSLVDIFWSKRTSLGWCCLLLSMVMSRSWCTQATGNVCMPLIMMHEIFWRRLQNLNKPCKMQKNYCWCYI